LEDSDLEGTVRVSTDDPSMLDDGIVILFTVGIFEDTVEFDNDEVDDEDSVGPTQELANAHNVNPIGEKNKKRKAMEGIIRKENSLSR